MRRRRTFGLVLAAVMAASLVAATGASATFHLMKIREISPGTDGLDDSYVEIQMYFNYQNFLSGGARLVRCNSDCSSSAIFPPSNPFTDVANGNTQDTVLFGDTGIAGGSKDFDVNLNLDQSKAGGAVCYLSEPGYTDCVSWGNFSASASLTTTYGSSANPGTPAPALVSGMALRRSIAPGCSTLLESSDDTNNSASDFSAAAPNPRTNASAPIETPCPPSGGGGGGGSGATPPPAPSHKKKCKKAKKRAAAAKKCKKRKR